MALDADTLAALIDTKYAAINTDYAGSDSRDAIKDGLFTAIAQAVIEHLQADGEVTLTGTDAGGDGPGSLAGTID